MIKKMIALAVSVVLAAGALSGCGNTNSAESGSSASSAEQGKTITSAADLAGAKIAVQEGTTGDNYVTDEVEGAEISRFKRVVDAGMDLKNGKVDAVVVDDQVAKDLVAEIDGLKILPGNLTEEEYAIAVKKGSEELLAGINSSIKEMNENGTIDTIRKAFIDKDDAAMQELQAKEAPAGDEKLVMGTNAEFAPFEYMDDNNEIAGYDVEIAKEIARKMGRELVIENMNFDSLIAALSSGKVDMVIAGMTVDEERKQQVDFSDSYYKAAQVIIVKE
ncbi:transporter substrate-binding domain-containing protein [Ructibacterium gallinarum]|uniref:Transporter substrate-binding domain-containing protein n=1 Tax=Ructibacterium gallinarum TaxID=2779355 RepID=A0A9D5M6K8_9FIRM|nr:transporter substrate-binding domain-containing protein [Ructibacterium gallinarum]MBE5040457.1 transporter substrate-binding domain-containing protein [Ructibacterium gallinarum]